jgi:acyl-homoserine lactone acylase PvdQ
VLLARAFALLVLVAAASFAAEKLEILRDEYGVPHIYARTAAGAAFGSGYAQAVDRGEQLLKNLKSAERNGVSSTLSPRMRAIVEAYCAGVNAYFGGTQVEPAMVEAFSRSAFGLIPESHDILIAPSRSSEKSVIAVLVPYAEWSGAARLYALEVETTDGFAFAGMGPLGVPFPLIGHSDAIAIAVHGAGAGGDNVLDQTWAMVTSRTLDEAKRAIAMGQLPAQKFLIGTAAGDIYDNRDGTTNPPEGILLSGGGVLQAAAMTRDLIAHWNSFSAESAASLAFATEVYKADTWQLRIAQTAPGSEFVRMLTGWSRKAEVNSRPALAFYLFKMALAEDAPAVEPPQHLTEERLRAAVRKAQDRLETEFPINATYGSVFRMMRDGERRSWPVGGGTAAEAGMATPRAIAFERRGALMIGHAGQAGVQVVALSRPIKSVIALPFGESDSPESPHFEDQARQLFGRSLTTSTWFGDRKNLEKRSKERKELVAP